MAWLRKFVLPPSVSGAAGLAVKPVGCRETFSILFLCPQAHLICSLGQLWGLGGGFQAEAKDMAFVPSGLKTSKIDVLWFAIACS